MEYLKPKYYGRCYVQKQSVYVEVSTEKDALSAIIESELWTYCTRLNVIRGQNSTTKVKEMASRFDAAVMRGQKPILLHVGDLDPSGVGIPKSMEKRFRERHLVDVDVRIIALLPDHIKQYHLPYSLDAVKTTDPNYNAWLKVYGPDQPAVELDALKPNEIKMLLREALQNVYNLDQFDKEIKNERRDREKNKPH